jgi:hypothetical protein
MLWVFFLMFLVTRVPLMLDMFKTFGIISWTVKEVAQNCDGSNVSLLVSITGYLVLIWPKVYDPDHVLLRFLV